MERKSKLTQWIVDAHLMGIKMDSSAQSMGEVFSSLTAALGAADKVLELIMREPQILPATHYKPGSFSGNLALERVNFSYPARPDSTVLTDLSFSITPGEVCCSQGLILQIHSSP